MFKIERKSDGMTNNNDELLVRALNYLKRAKLIISIKKFEDKPNFLMDMLKNDNELLKMTKIVFENYRSYVVKGNADLVFKDNFIVAILETYCVLNNIKIIFDDFLDDEESKSSIESIESLKTYLQEIGSLPLLTKEEEKNLAIRISNGDMSARKMFVERHLRLVIKNVKKFLNRGVPILDLIQEGNVCLLNVVDTFNFDKNIDFTSYANWKIRLALNSAVQNQGRNIKIPTLWIEQITRLDETYDYLKDELGREPTLSEIAQKMQLSIKKIVDLYKLKDDTISMNPLNHDDERFSDYIGLQDNLVEDVVIGDLMRLHFRKFIDECNLTAAQKEVISLRYGLDGTEPQNRTEIATSRHISGEGVRQLEMAALKKMRHNINAAQFNVNTGNAEGQIKKVVKSNKTKV